MCQHVETGLPARRDFLRSAILGSTGVGLAAHLGLSPAVAEEKAETVDRETVKKLIADWPAKCREVSQWMIEHHGLPNEGTPTHLVWYQNGPWKFSVVYSEEVPHNFPVKHTDMLDQIIDYKVPAEKMDELAEFDGAVTVRITKGEMGAMCDKEANNFLAINLAHEIVVGKRSVKEAREFQTKVIKASLKGESHEYLEKFVFELPTGNTGYPDVLAEG